MIIRAGGRAGHKKGNTGMMHVVTGGSGSGKSAYAEQIICHCHEGITDIQARGKLYYVATMIPYGEETAAKIERHRTMRAGKGFETLECYTGLSAALIEKSPGAKAAAPCVLLECMSNLVANELYQEGKAGRNAVEAVMDGIQELKLQCREFVIVTNEVFSDTGDISEEMKFYSRVLGEINCRMAQMADSVTEVVYGIPVLLKNCGTRVQKKESEKEEGGAGMKMVVGGAYQGKLDFARSLYGGEDWADGGIYCAEALCECRGIYHFQEYIRRMLQEKKDPLEMARTLVAENPDIIIVSDEIGYGLVPVDTFEREYREQTGRVCTWLAGQAERIDRVVCGIGTVIKGGTKNNED